MEISEEMRDFAITEFRKIESRALKEVGKIKTKARGIDINFIFDGVMDTAHYDMQEKRFTFLRLKMATEGIVLIDYMPSKTACYCNKAEYVEVLL
jgi:hypothetical protein